MEDKLINDSRPTFFSQRAMIVYKAGIGGIGERNSSAMNEAFATTAGVVVDMNISQKQV